MRPWLFAYEDGCGLRLAAASVLAAMLGKEKKEATAMLFFSNGDPSEACVNIGYGGYCVTIGMRKLDDSERGVCLA